MQMSPQVHDENTITQVSSTCKRLSSDDEEINSCARTLPRLPTLPSSKPIKVKKEKLSKRPRKGSRKGYKLSHAAVVADKSLIKTSCVPTTINEMCEESAANGQGSYTGNNKILM